MADNNFQRPQRKKTALSNRKYSLTERNQDGKNANLNWDYQKNNPSITVWTGVESDKANDNGKIVAAMDDIVVEGLFDLIERAADFDTEGGTKDFRDKISNKNFIFPGGKRSDAPVNVSETWVGKDKEGKVWISVLSFKQDRPKIRFYFKFSDFHTFVHGSGEAYSEAEASVVAARAYARKLRHVIAHLSVTEWVEPEPRPQQGGYGGRGNGGGGGWQGNGGGNGGGNQGGNSGGGDFGGENIPW